MAKKISISDVASALHVSKTTISFIINGRAKEKRISDALTEKVLKYIAENGFKPNQLAQSLSTGKTKTIGLMVEKISDYFFAQMAYHIEDIAYQNGYKILYCSTDNDVERAKVLVKLFRDRQVDGYIITAPAGMEDEIQGLLDDGFPVVLFDRFFKDLDSSYVVLDNFRASYDATQYLIANNYHNIALVELDSEQSQMHDRKLGYLTALEEVGLEPLVEMVKYSNDTNQTVEQLVKFIQNNPRIDSLFFATNYLAFSGIKALNNLKLKTPENIGIVAFDDHEVFNLYTPTITAVAQPIAELAKESIRVLLTMLNNKKGGFLFEKIVVPAHFIVRDSTNKMQKA